MTSETSQTPHPPTQWQLWDLILSHLHNAPSSKISISGAGRQVSQSGSYMCNDFYYASDDMQKAKIAYIRLQDNMELSILQNCILPPWIALRIRLMCWRRCLCRGLRKMRFGMFRPLLTSTNTLHMDVSVSVECGRANMRPISVNFFSTMNLPA
jgi:hypothetical protein